MCGIPKVRCMFLPGKSGLAYLKVYFICGNKTSPLGNDQIHADGEVGPSSRFPGRPAGSSLL